MRQGREVSEILETCVCVFVCVLAERIENKIVIRILSALFHMRVHSNLDLLSYLRVSKLRWTTANHNSLYKC
jgi:hypothetical protein